MRTSKQAISFDLSRWTAKSDIRSETPPRPVNLCFCCIVMCAVACMSAVSTTSAEPKPTPLAAWLIEWAGCDKGLCVHVGCDTGLLTGVLVRLG